MNTVEKNNYQITEETIGEVNVAAKRISSLNGFPSATYHHIAFNIEWKKGLDCKDSSLGVVTSETKLDKDSVFADLLSRVSNEENQLSGSVILATEITFLVNRKKDIETLLTNLRETLKDLALQGGDIPFCFSISVKNCKIDITDICNYIFTNGTFLTYHTFHNYSENTLYMLSNALEAKKKVA